MSQVSIVPVLVEDQDEALRFYIEKLGFEKRADVTYGPGMRWVTVALQGQRRPEIALAKPDISLYPMRRREQRDAAWVFETDDCYTMYATLLARGVRFLSPPTHKLYGVEAVFEDPYGNVFALLERSAEAHSVYKRDTAA